MPKPLPTGARRTPRLVLRPFHRRDADALVEAVWASLAELSRWLPWPHPRYGRSDALRFIRDSVAAWEDGRAHDLAIRTHTDGATHLGNISVWPTSRREQAGEVGYWIRSDATGQVIATEAAARVLQIAFDELALHRVVLRVAVGNRASERVAEKLGFVHEGLLRKEVLVAGTWLDHTLWAMLDEEFHRLRPGYLERGWLDRAE
jgi:ribosomal-protein-serine acetyltransferase